MPSTPSIAQLRKAAALREIPETGVRRLLEATRTREVEAGEPLFEENAPGDAVYLVLRGAVAIRRELEPGRSVLLALRGPSEWVGELALTDDARRSATAVAEGATTLLEVPRQRFVALLERHPRAALDLLHMEAQRLRESDGALLDAVRKRTEELRAANAQLDAEVRRLRREEPQGDLERWLGASKAAARVRHAGARAARDDQPVLVVGEPGVGKALLARLLHEASRRSEGPFVALDAAELGHAAAEAKLFGHAAGALPGIREAGAGALERADEGTLYLANLDALSRGAQSALFRFLERSEWERLGETSSRRADVRLVASLEGDPAALVAAGALRDELLQRLGAQRIDVPPLRERRTDVPLLASHFAEQSAQRRGTAPLVLDASALRVLGRHVFPGNADELREEMEALAATLEPGARVVSQDLGARFLYGEPALEGLYSDTVRAFKARVIERAVVAAGGNRAEAAKRLGLHRSNLTRMIRMLRLDKALPEPTGPGRQRRR